MMVEIFEQQPWLLIIAMGIMVPITGVIFGTVTGYLRRVRQAELDAGLKHAMLERGMSAEEIRTVIEAASPRWGKRMGRVGNLARLLDAIQASSGGSRAGCCGRATEREQPSRS